MRILCYEKLDEGRVKYDDDITVTMIMVKEWDREVRSSLLTLRGQFEVNDF